MSTQPEALRLADFIGSEMPIPNWAKYEAAAELRRLHEVNAELLKALIDVVDFTGAYGGPYVAARVVIAKATGGKQ